MAHFTKVDSFQIDEDERPKAGETYCTPSGAEFTVDEDGFLKVTKSLGCLGCDLAWPIVDVDGLPAHQCSPNDTMTCQRPRN